MLSVLIGIPELVLKIYDITHKLVLSSGPAEIDKAFKLFQKVLYLLQSDILDDERMKLILDRLSEIKVWITSKTDESLYLSYLEMLRKFLLSHIENVKDIAQKEMVLTFYNQTYEFYSLSETKKFQTLVMIKRL